MIATLRSLWTDATDGTRYEAFEAAQTGDGPTRFQFERARLVYFLHMVVAVATCWLRGHDIECEGYAGPETASETFSCARCGWSHEVTYY